MVVTDEGKDGNVAVLGRAKILPLTAAMVGIGFAVFACSTPRAAPPQEANPAEQRSESGPETVAPAPAPTAAGPPVSPSIAEASVPLQTTGWFLPASHLAEPGGDDDGFESNPDGALAQDGVEAADIDSGTATAASCLSAAKDRQLFWDLDVSLPSVFAIIDGIEVGFRARADDSVGKAYFCAQLSWDGGRTWTDSQRTNQLTETSQLLVAGLPGESWGRFWSLADLSDRSFRVRVISVSGNPERDFFIEWVGVRVSYH